MKFHQKLLFVLTLFIISCKYALIQSVADRDLWHRLAVGKLVFQTGSVLNHDIFSYVLTKPVWIDHEWGSGVVFYILASHFGDYGLLSIKFIILSIILILIYSANQLISGKKEDLKIGFYVVALLTIILGFVNTTRCLVFTYLFFALWIYILERVRRGDNKLIWIFPVTMVCWVNLHAGFLSGFGLLILYAVGEFLNKKNYIKYFKIFMLSLLAAFINPYGLNFWRYLISAVTMTRPNVMEWMPTNILGPLQDFIAFKILLIMTVIGYICKFIKKDWRIDWVAILVIGVTLTLALQHIRHQVFFGIAASIFSQHHYFYKESKKLKPSKIAIINAVILFFCGCYIYLNPLYVRASEPQYPAKAVEFIKINQLRGNLLTTFNWGSYALWKLYPQCRVFEDGRYEEVYFDESNADLDNFMYSRKNWKNIFKKYHHDIILIENTPELINKIESLKSWKIIYQDKTSVIFIPKSVKQNKWILPEKNIDLDKTKYINTI